MPKQDFDQAAHTYDVEFSNTLIGKAQRELVWEHLTSSLHGDVNCLELNGGTGVDAEYIAPNVKKLLTTDISERMVEVASARLEDFINVEAKVLDVNLLNENLLKDKDIVFSNFGGLNCLSHEEWKRFAQRLSSYLKQDSKLAFVIMSKNCWWENLYFMLKGKKWNRNSSDPVMANVSGENVATWYYSPEEIISFLKSDFNLTKLKPIGFFIPPSYLTPFFEKHSKVFSILNFLEKRIKNWSFLAGRSDHFYVEFSKMAND